MKKLFNFLLPDTKQSCRTAVVLFAARVVFALLLANHGWQKLQGFSAMADKFPDPLGVGSSLSLSLATFAELICSLGLAFGVLTRLALLPIIFTMCIAFFVAHGGSLAEGELAFVYLVAFILLFSAGPGRFSVDGWMAKRFGGR